MSQTVTPLQATVPTAGIVKATSPRDLTQNALNDPALMELLTQALGPYMRQYGHSAAVGAIGPVMILIAGYLGYTLSPDVSNILSVILFVVTSYAWQAFSIWRGKANAPVQPAPSAAP